MDKNPPNCMEIASVIIKTPILWNRMFILRDDF